MKLSDAMTTALLSGHPSGPLQGNRWIWQRLVNLGLAAWAAGGQRAFLTHEGQRRAAELATRAFQQHHYRRPRGKEPARR